MNLKMNATDFRFVVSCETTWSSVECQTALGFDTQATQPKTLFRKATKVYA